MSRIYFKKNSSKFLVGSILILLLAFFIVGYPISDIYNRLFLPQPERVTELYFNSPDSLPRVVVQKVPSFFTFHTANHEAQPVTYSFIATLQTSDSPVQTIASGSFVIPDGGSVDTPISFVIPKKGIRSLVTIQFIGRSEAIHFWVSS